MAAFQAKLRSHSFVPVEANNYNSSKAAIEEVIIGLARAHLITGILSFADAPTV